MRIQPMSEIMRQHVLIALKHYNYNITHTAAALGYSRDGLYGLAKRLKVSTRQSPKGNYDGK